MSVFADSFDIRGMQHTRCEQPMGDLVPKTHHELNLPAGVGRTTFDVYADYHGPAIYVRLVRMSDGEVGWFRASLSAVDGSRA